MARPASAPNAPHTPWIRSAALGIALSAVVCVIVLAFSWPSVTLDPKDLPVAITGPDAAVTQVEDAVAKSSDGAIELHRVDSRAEAVSRIRHREAYGAIVLGASPEVLTSSAASTVTNQLMTQLHTQIQTSVQQQVAAAAAAAGSPMTPTVTVKLTDVVPLVSEDPRGAGLTAAALPLVFGGMIGGIGITFAVSGAWRRVVALLVYAVVGGLAIAGIMQGWFQVLPGDFLSVAGAFSLTLGAMGATIVGFGSLIGRPGVAVGPVLFMLIGNPISGSTFPKEFYPQPWGAVGQFLPPGAGATLLRDVTYFPQASIAQPALVLSCWIVLGLLLVTLGHFRNQGRLAVEENPRDAAAEAVAA